jgi:hypothetical protein
MKHLRLLLPLFLLLAVAAPVAAVEEPSPSAEPIAVPYALPGEVSTPCADELAAAVALGEPVLVTESCLLPDGSVLPINVMTIAEPMPISEPLPCDQAIVDAASSETPLIAPAPCLLPDGTLYELAARGTMPNERGDGEVDYETLYADWLAEFTAGLEPCPEGADPADPTLMTCLLPDGTIAGPMPLFSAPMPADGEVTPIAAEVSEDREMTLALYALFAGLGVAAVAAALIVRTRRQAD